MLLIGKIIADDEHLATETRYIQAITKRCPATRYNIIIVRNDMYGNAPQAALEGNEAVVRPLLDHRQTLRVAGSIQALQS